MSQEFLDGQPQHQERSVGDIASQGDDNVINIVQGDGAVITITKTSIIQLPPEEVKRQRQFDRNSPYKGLQAFEERDHDRFFGRHQFVAKLARELGQSPLILVLGASGSGKSSVIRAGLIPSLAKTYSHFVDLTFTPNQDPFEGLYASLRPYAKDQAVIARAGKENTLVQVVKTLKSPDAQWLIFIDQFEELFTTSLPEKRQAFLAGLVQLNEWLVKHKNHSVQIVATMRSDFSDRLNEHPKLVNALKNQCLIVTGMHSDELRLAIEQPAMQHGVIFESDLVEEIIKDVRGQAGYLPLLQYTLDLLWETERKSGDLDDRMLNFNTYLQLGGVRGALQQHVDTIYGKLLPAEQIAAQQIFLKLVEIGSDEKSGTGWKPVRKRAIRSQFADATENSVLTKLIDQKLLVSNASVETENGHFKSSQNSTVEIAHEVLLTSWTTLNRWITENRQAIDLRNRLNHDAELWRQKNRAESELWGGTKLQLASDLRDDSTFRQVLGGFDALANQFINASIKLKKQQRNRLISGLIGFCAVALVLVGVAGWQWRQAVQQNIFTLIESADARVGSHEKLKAIISSIKAAKLAQKFNYSDALAKAEQALLKALYSGESEDNQLIGHQEGIASVVFSPNGKYLASTGKDKTIRIWNNTGQQIALVEANEQMNFLTAFNSLISEPSVVFSPNSKYFTAFTSDDKTHIWDLTGREIASLMGAFQGFSSDNKYIATTATDIVQLWDFAGTPVESYKTHKKEWARVSFSPDSRYLAIVYENEFQLWNIESKAVVYLDIGQYETSGFNFSPNSKYIATSTYLRDENGKNARIQIWNLTGKQIAPIKQIDDPQLVRFAPDGKFVIFLDEAEEEDILHLWDFTKNRDYQFLKNLNFRMILNADFSPAPFYGDPAKIITLEEDNLAKIWDISEYEESPDEHDDQGDRGASLNTTLKATVNVISVSPNGTLTTLGLDNSIRMWDNQGYQQIALLQQSSNTINDIALSPNGQYMASGGEDGVVRWWDFRSKQIVSLQENQEYTSSDARLWTLKDGQIEYFGNKKDVKDEQNLRGKYLVTSRFRDVAQFWSLTNKQVTQSHRLREMGYKIKFNWSGEYFVAFKKGELTQIWNSTGEKFLIPDSDQDSDSAISILFSPYSNHLAIVNNNNGVIRLLTTSGEQLGLIKTNLHETNIYPLEIRFSPNGKHLAIFGRDTQGYVAQLWSFTGNQLARLPSSYSLAKQGSTFSSDGQYLAVAGEDLRAVEILDLTGKKITQFELSNEILTAQFSPNGKYLVTGERNGLELWDIEKKQNLRSFGISSFNNTYTEVAEVAFSQDGQYVAASDGHSLLVYDLSAKQSSFVAKDLTGYKTIHDISFTANGEYLITGNGTTAQVWAMKGKSLLAQGCSWISNYLNNSTVALTEEEQHLCNGIEVKAQGQVTTDQNEGSEAKAFSEPIKIVRFPRKRGG